MYVYHSLLVEPADEPSGHTQVAWLPPLPEVCLFSPPGVPLTANDWCEHGVVNATCQPGEGTREEGYPTHVILHLAHRKQTPHKIRC
jgi:hypothetical protein